MGTARNSYWTVASTVDQSGIDAARSLRDLGYRYYHPRYRAAVHRGVRKVLPLFPGYIFVHVNVKRDRWQELNSAKGVRRVFLSGELPARILDQDIRDLKSHEDDAGYYFFPELETPKFSLEQDVIVSRGTLGGRFGTVTEIVKRDTVRVLFAMLGRGKIELPMSVFDLQPVRLVG